MQTIHEQGATVRRGDPEPVSAGYYHCTGGDHELLICIGGFDKLVADEVVIDEIATAIERAIGRLLRELTAPKEGR